MTYFYIVYDTVTGTIKRSGNAYSRSEMHAQAVGENEDIIEAEMFGSFTGYHVDINTRTLVRM